MNIILNRLFLSISILTLLFFYSTTPLAAQQNTNQFESEIEAFEKADAQQMPPENAILFVGSSSIRMWHSLGSDFPDKEVINRGFGGSQFSDLLFYMDRIVIPYEPRQIFVYEGDNDVYADLTPETILDDFKLFVSRVKDELPQTEVLFISIKPSPSRKNVFSEMKEANKLIKNYAESTPDVTYVDVFKPMLTESGDIRSDIFLGDNLHLNEKGYEIWKETILPYLN